MDLSRIAIAPRLRTGWEAIDLGFVLAKAWYRELFLSWTVPYLLLLVPSLLILAAFPDWGSTAAVFGVWWLKPLIDRIPLYILSRQLFGDKTSVPEALNQAPSLLKRDWFLALTWRRFSPTRSFDMAVTVLEGLSGNQRARRLSGLHRKASGAAIALTFFCVTAEMVLLFGFYAAIGLMVPEQVEFDSQALMDAEGYYLTVFTGLATGLAACLVAPFYTAAGFTLYISRRIELEAWDIEVRFRDLSNRINKPDRLKQMLSLIAAVGLAIGLSVPSAPVHAEESPHASARLDAEESQIAIDTVAGDFSASARSSKQTSQQRIREILNHDDFHRREIDSGYRLKTPVENKDEADEEEEKSDEDSAIYKFLQALGNLLEPLGYFFSSLSNFIELLLWIIAVSLLIYVLWYFRDSIKQVAGWRPPQSAAKEEKKPEVLFGLEVTEEAIQDNVVDKVMTLFQNGEARAALSLLYGSTLARLLHHHDCPFHDGMTEGECLKLVKVRAEAQAVHFRQLTNIWIQLAYAHRDPQLVEIETLCADWEAVYVQVDE